MERYSSSFGTASTSVLELERTDDLGVSSTSIASNGKPPAIAARSDQDRAAIAPTASSPVSPSDAPRTPWRVFVTTFITIFLAELGDKTQLSTLLMSAEFHKPWIVFLGAGSALVTTTLVGVLLGQWLATRLSPRTLDIAAGLMLALISVWLMWDVFQL